MATISASQVNELRRKTGVGMMDCKKALVACDGDMEAAIDHLRKIGMAKAEKKAGRSATQGIFVSLVKDNVGTLIELLCETDFVAKTDSFKEFGAKVAEKVVNEFDDNGDISEKLAAAMQGELKELIAKIGENMQLRRAVRWVSNGRIGSYLHTGVAYGVLVDVEGECDDELLANICMHVTAFSPRFILPADVPEELIARERDIAAAQLEGKPANMVENIVQGKLSKWYTEICLSKQPWINDQKSSLEKVAPNLSVKRMVRWQVGEEI
jgi:elongation factor Ts